MDQKKMAPGGQILFPFTENFLNDGPLPGGWIGPAWTVSGGKAVNAPTVGGETLPDPGLEANYTDGLCDSLLKQMTPAVSQSADAHGGSKAQSFQSLGSNYSVLTNNTKHTLSVGTWYQLGMWVKRVTNNSSIPFVLNLTAGFGSGRQITGPSTSSYTERVTSGVCTSANFKIDWMTASAVNGDVALLDDLSVKPLTLTTLLAARNAGRSDLSIQVEVTMSGLPTICPVAGIIACLDSPTDPKNFLLAFHNGTYAYLMKCVNGTYTGLIAAMATYAAGRVLKIVKNGTAVALYYHGTQVGSTQTVSDASIISNTQHGMFSTHATNQFDAFAMF